MNVLVFVVFLCFHLVLHFLFFKKCNIFPVTWGVTLFLEKKSVTNCYLCVFSLLPAVTLFNFKNCNKFCYGFSCYTFIRRKKCNMWFLLVYLVLQFLFLKSVTCFHCHLFVTLLFGEKSVTILRFIIVTFFVTLCIFDFVVRYLTLCYTFYFLNL